MIFLISWNSCQVVNWLRVSPIVEKTILISSRVFFQLEKKNSGTLFFLSKTGNSCFWQIDIFRGGRRCWKGDGYDLKKLTIVYLFSIWRSTSHTHTLVHTHARSPLSLSHKHARTLTPHLREKGLRMLALNSNPLKLSPTVCANKTLAGRNKKQNIKCPMNNNLSKDLGLNGSSRLKESNPDFSVER